MILAIKKAQSYFYQKDYKKAYKIFAELNDFYSAGLCCLLLKKKNFAKKYWQKSKFNSPASVWGLGLLDLIDLKNTKNRLSFFQTRAQLEIYLNLFIENKLYEWAQNLISCEEILFQSNQESYKFIARALFSNGYFDLAINFCKKSIKVFYCDPESFLIMAQCYYLKGELGESLDCINRVLNMVDNYFPAIIFRNILKEEINKKC